MRTFSNGSIPLFLGHSGIGELPGAPQIKVFDVFYDLPLAVGFHVMGAPPDVVAGFFITETPDTLLFFNVFDVTMPVQSGEPVIFFNVFDVVAIPSEDVVMFFNVLDIVSEDSNEPVLFFNVFEEVPC